MNRSSRRSATFLTLGLAAVACGERAVGAGTPVSTDAAPDASLGDGAGIDSSPSCADGFAECDGLVDNGCETEIASDPSSCGACDNACPDARGAPSCVQGSCAITCFAGSGDCDGDPSNGCETDLENDPEHCGACGRSCQGASCALALCEGVWLTNEKSTSLADLNAAAIALDDTHVYYARGDGDVRRVPKSGGASEVVFPAAQGSAWDLALDATHLYLTDVSGRRVVRVAKDGSGPIENLGTISKPIIGQASLVYLAVDAEHVYWTDTVYGPSPGIRRAPKQGGSESLWYSSAPDQMTGLALHDGWVYFAQAQNGVGVIGRAHAADPVGSAESTIAVPLAGGPLVVDESGAYFRVGGTETETGGVVRWVPGTTMLTSIAQNDYVKWLVLDSSRVFVRADSGATNEGRLLAADKSGSGSLQPVLTKMGQDDAGGLRSIAVDDTHVYVNLPAQKGILKVAK